MIEVRRLRGSDEAQRNRDIKYVVQFGESRKYLTEKQLLELKVKLNEFIVEKLSFVASDEKSYDGSAENWCKVDEKRFEYSILRCDWMGLKSFEQNTDWREAYEIFEIGIIHPEKGVISYKVPKGLKLSDITMSEENKQQNMEAVQYDTVLSNVDLQNNLKEIGFKSIGSGWYENEEHRIRLRLWKDCEIDFWLHRSSVDEDDNELRFRGKIYKFDDVRWVLNRCFGYIA